MMTGVGVAAAHTLTNPPDYLRAVIAGTCSVVSVKFGGVGCCMLGHAYVCFSMCEYVCAWVRCYVIVGLAAVHAI
jgi:hypothetical protein